MAEGLVEPRERQSGESPGRWRQPHHHGLELQRDVTDDPVRPDLRTASATPPATLAPLTVMAH